MAGDNKLPTVPVALDYYDLMILSQVISFVQEKIDEDDEDYHPSMGPSEQVTCPTCREWLGLPPIWKEDHD